MKHFSFLLLIIALIGLISCESERKELEPNLTPLTTENIAPDLKVVDGVLCFKNDESVEIIKNQIKGSNETELTLWEEKIGFKSIESVRKEIEDAIFCRAEEFVAGGLSHEEVLNKYDTKELEEVPLNLEERIKNLGLIYEKDENGLRLLRYSSLIPFITRFLNEKYEVVISDTLYRYFPDRIEIYPNFGTFDKETALPEMIARRSIIKDDPLLKDVPVTTKSAQLCFDIFEDYENTDHKLSAQFRVERYIYQKSNCPDDCIKTKAYAKIYFQSQYHNWLGWHTGTYYGYGASSFDVKYYNNVTQTTTIVGGLTPSYSQEFSPIQLYYSGEMSNEAITWIAIGNVDCTNVDIGFDTECVWAQAYGTDGSQPRYGYSANSYLMNDF